MSHVRDHRLQTQRGYTFRCQQQPNAPAWWRPRYPCARHHEPAYWPVGVKGSPDGQASPAPSMSIKLSRDCFEDVCGWRWHDCLRACIR